MMATIVTGGTGFMGLAVCRRLSADGKHVVALDNFDRTYDQRVKDYRRAQLATLPNVTLLNCDITDMGQLSEVFTTHDISAVVNLAARAGIRESVDDPIGFFRVNTMGVINLLELCRIHAVCNLVHFSTSSVYGDAATPFSEDTTGTDSPLSPYAASKKASEAICHVYSKLQGIRTTIFRPFTIYGPAGRPDMSIFRFIRWIYEGEPVRVFGGGQSRDFVFSEDVANAVALALDLGLEYEEINIGGGDTITLEGLIALIGEICGKEPNVRYEPANSADAKATLADISKGHRILGWTPRVSIKQGLTQTVEWYEQNRAWARDLNL